MTTATLSSIQKSEIAFAREFPRLIRENPGDWVLFVDGNLKGTFNSQHGVLGFSQKEKISPRDIFTVRIVAQSLLDTGSVSDVGYFPSQC